VKTFEALRYCAFLLHRWRRISWIAERLSVSPWGPDDTLLRHRVWLKFRIYALYPTIYENFIPYCSAVSSLLFACFIFFSVFLCLSLPNLLCGPSCNISAIYETFLCVVEGRRLVSVPSLWLVPTSSSLCINNAALQQTVAKCIPILTLSLSPSLCIFVHILKFGLRRFLTSSYSLCNTTCSGLTDSRQVYKIVDEDWCFVVTLFCFQFEQKYYK
jgi:hypothetical protein